MSSAPPTASVIRKWMLSVRCRRAIQPFFKVGPPASAMDKAARDITGQLTSSCVTQPTDVVQAVVGRQLALEQVEVQAFNAAHAAQLLPDQPLLGRAVHLLDAPANGRRAGWCGGRARRRGAEVWSTTIGTCVIVRMGRPGVLGMFFPMFVIVAAWGRAFSRRC